MSGDISRSMSGYRNRRRILGVFVVVALAVKCAGVLTFYNLLRRVVEASTLSEKTRRRVSLNPPPPHVTTHTSDPNGKMGIGLKSSTLLEAALHAYNQGVDTGLRARKLTQCSTPKQEK